MDDRPFIIEKCTGKKRYDVVEVTCLTCKNVFLTRTNNGTGGVSKYCNPKCAKQKDPSLYANFSCATCGTNITRLKSKTKTTTVFCNRVCRGKHTSLKNIVKYKEIRVNPNHKLDKVSLKICPNCNNPFYGGRAKGFCCGSCRNEKKQKDFEDAWLSGTLVIKESESIPVRIRRYLFKKYNSSCADCGWGEVNISTNKIPLQVHHIDGSYKNNKPENLILLCPNCHSLTPTFGALNIGNGRETRKIKKSLGGACTKVSDFDLQSEC